MKKTATGLLLLFFAVFTLRIGVERTESALAGWSSHSDSHHAAVHSQNPRPKFSRITGSEFVQEELGHSKATLFIAAEIPAVFTERLIEPAIGDSFPRPPPINPPIA